MRSYLGQEVIKMLNFVLFMKKDRELFAQHNNKAYICTKLLASLHWRGVNH
jgi:hypothetical protein